MSDISSFEVAQVTAVRWFNDLASTLDTSCVFNMFDLYFGWELFSC